MVKYFREAGVRMKVLSKVFKCIIGVPLSILGMIIFVVLYVIPSPIKF